MMIRSMLGRVLTVTVWFGFLCLPMFCAQSTLAQSDREMIAVFDFGADGNVDKSQTRAASDRLREQLASTGKYTVVNQDQFDAALRRQLNRQLSNYCDSDCAVMVGKNLGVRKLVWGGTLGVSRAHWYLAAWWLNVGTDQPHDPVVVSFSGDFASLLSKGVPNFAAKLIEASPKDMATAERARPSVQAVTPIPQPKAPTPSPAVAGPSPANDDSRQLAACLNQATKIHQLYRQMPIANIATDKCTDYGNGSEAGCNVKTQNKLVDIYQERNRKFRAALNDPAQKSCETFGVYYEYDHFSDPTKVHGAMHNKFDSRYSYDLNADQDPDWGGGSTVASAGAETPASLTRNVANSVGGSGNSESTTTDNGPSTGEMIIQGLQQFQQSQQRSGTSVGGMGSLNQAAASTKNQAAASTKQKCQYPSSYYSSQAQQARNGAAQARAQAAALGGSRASGSFADNYTRQANALDAAATNWDSQAQACQ